MNTINTVQEQNIPDDSIEVKIEVNGNFSQKEANELKKFVVERIMGRKIDYYGELIRFCNKRKYRVEKNHHVVTIYK